MSRKVDEATRIQRDYYRATATQYDAMHADEGGDDYRSIRIVSLLINMLRAGTVLDVGAGTGVGVSHLMEALPHAYVCGIEPVAALVENGVRRDEALKRAIVRGAGESLPFADRSFDAVCSFALLHHVSKPETVIREMLRVASKAVIIVDSNRFGQGSKPARWLKLILYKMGLWPFVNYLKTAGKGYLITPGDGLAYSYSVYDSLDCLAPWAGQLITIPSEPCKATSWLHPLLTARGVILCAAKDPVSPR